MPELPEVQTTVSGLEKVLPRLRITDVWTDLASKRATQGESIKHADYFSYFKKAIRGSRVDKVRRRAKNILIDLNNGMTILIHMKMTGHLLYGKYAKKNGVWLPAKTGPLTDPFNRFIHLVFVLSNGMHLALSDMRKFAKIVAVPTKEIGASEHLDSIGPEPLDRGFTLKKFITAISRKPDQKIKLVLMDQSVIAGIGNIYSDEMLWHAGIHPFEQVKNISPVKIKKMFTAMKLVLKKGIDFSGDSTSDYRNIYGERGAFHLHHNAYRKTGFPCAKHDGGVILRKKIGGRSAHFCSVHQQLQK